MNADVTKSAAKGLDQLATEVLANAIHAGC